MALRYVIEITDDPSGHCCFSYIDTEDSLAGILFEHLKIDAEQEMVFHRDNDPYRIVVCRVPREQREAFLRAMDLLPSLMEYAGRTDYEEYCLEFFLYSERRLRENRNSGNITRLQ